MLFDSDSRIIAEELCEARHVVVPMTDSVVAGDSVDFWVRVSDDDAERVDVNELVYERVKLRRMAELVGLERTV